MKKLLFVGLMLCAVMAGLVASELLVRSATFRDLAGRLSGRGPLAAIANGKGIYETDLGGSAGFIARDLVVAINLRRAAAAEVIDRAQVEREFGLLQAQFGSHQRFDEALRASGFSVASLREEIAAQLRGCLWLEKQITPAAGVTEQECRQFYASHPNLFTQPLRFRAAHLLLAAHTETPPEIVEEKEMAIADLGKRLAKGEPLSHLAAEASEDEATKNRGGDLGFFAESRMAPEFIAEIRKLPVGKLSKPFRSHLGFHIAQVTEIKAPRLLSFEEVRPEIALAIANERRALQVDTLVQILNRADYLRPNAE
jgi:parvulin-like peptidyl-prolyl isomerase